jgi:hypothetical protein
MTERQRPAALSDMKRAEGARVCMCGCRRVLLREDGWPDWNRKFYSQECINLDKRRKTASNRRKLLTDPKVRITVDGHEVLGNSMGDVLKALRTMGHEIKTVRKQRKKQ